MLIETVYFLAAQNGGAQNGGHKSDEERRRHRKGKDGSGGLPLYLFCEFFFYILVPWRTADTKRFIHDHVY